MTRVESWSDIPIQTLVTLRRGPLTGEKVERTKAWTASGPYYSESGVACIRVDIGGAVVSYPLDRVSLGWEERVPAVTLAASLDPPAPPPMRFTELVVMSGAFYLVAVGLYSMVAWVLR